LVEPVVVVLEGKARGGAPSGTDDGVTVVHAEGSGDDALVDVIGDASAASHASAEEVVLVTADRELRRRAEALGAKVVGPTWLLERLANQ
jgi:rRNA-processing protein FCF1